MDRKTIHCSPRRVYVFFLIGLRSRIAAEMLVALATEVKRGDADFGAAAVSLGRLGVIYRATLEASSVEGTQIWKYKKKVGSIGEQKVRLFLSNVSSFVFPFSWRLGS